MSGRTASAVLARWVVDLRSEDLDPTTPRRRLTAARPSRLRRARLHRRHRRSGRAPLAALGAGDEGAAPPSSPPRPPRSEWAILANAVHAHSIELDDTHNASSLHPAVVTLPARGARGRRAKGASGIDRSPPPSPATRSPAASGARSCPRRPTRGASTPRPWSGPSPRRRAGKLLGLAARAAGPRLRHRRQPGGGAHGVLLAEGAWTKRLHPGWSQPRRLRRGAARGGRLHRPEDGRSRARTALLAGYGSADHLELVTAEPRRAVRARADQRQAARLLPLQPGADRPRDRARDRPRPDGRRRRAGDRRRRHPRGGHRRRAARSASSRRRTTSTRSSRCPSPSASASCTGAPRWTSTRRRRWAIPTCWPSPRAHEVEARPHLDAVFPERWPAELDHRDRRRPHPDGLPRTRPRATREPR